MSVIMVSSALTSSSPKDKASGLMRCSQTGSAQLSIRTHPHFKALSDLQVRARVKQEPAVIISAQ